MVFITQIDIAGLDAHHLRGHQQALQKTVRVALQVGAVFEGTGLALVDIDRHQFRASLLTHDAPLAPRRKAGPAQAAQARVFHGLEHVLGGLSAYGQRRRQRIAALGPVGLVAGVAGRHLHRLWQRRDRGLGISRCIKNNSARGKRVVGCSRFHDQSHGLQRGLQHRVLVHHRHRRLLAAAQAGRGDHPHIGTQNCRQPGQQGLGTGQLTAQAVAHPHGQHRAKHIVAQHLEVVIESGHLIHLGQR